MIPSSRPEPVGVSRRDFTAPGIGGRQPPELDPEHGGLDLVAPEIPADPLVVVALVRSMVAQGSGPGGEIGIPGHQHARVPAGPQVFGGIKTRDPDAPDPSHRIVPEPGPDGLGGVLDHRQVVVPGDLSNPIHGRRLTVEMDGEDGGGAFGDQALDTGGIEVEAGRANVREDRSGSRAGHASGGGKKT